MKNLVLERSAIKNNIDVVREKAGSAVIYAVLSGNGYGAGLVDLARVLRDNGVNHFAVTECRDAAALRKAGFVDEEVLMLRSTAVREELEELLDLNVVCAVGSYDAGVALNAIAEERSTVAEAHVQIDTGMGFGGFLTSEPEKLLSIYQYLPNVAISGTFTQFHAAGSIDTQLGEFKGAVEKIHAAGLETGILHAAGSSVLMSGRAPELDAVRVGSAFLGRCRRHRNDRLQTVGRGEATLEEVRWLPKGHTVGNEQLVTLRRPTRVAVLPVGYQNGLGVGDPRRSGLWDTLRRWWASRRLTVRVNGQRARVLGRPGAVETVIDVTELKCDVGDTASFEVNPLYAQGLTRQYR